MTTQVPAPSATTFGADNRNRVPRIGRSSSGLAAVSRSRDSARSSGPATGISATPISDICSLTAGD